MTARRPLPAQVKAVRLAIARVLTAAGCAPIDREILDRAAAAAWRASVADDPVPLQRQVEP